MSDFAKIIIALIAAVALVAAMNSASRVGVERMKTCRAQPELCEMLISSGEE